MSWRQSGSFRPKNSSSQAPRPNNGSGPPLLDPILQVMIVTSLVVGLVGLGLMAAFGGSLGQGGQTVAQPAQPAARPTAPPMATAAPAAANPTPAPAAPATIPPEPLGPALATGSGTAITIGTDAVQLIFNQTSVSAPNGLITLTFRNLATAVQHNWVLVNGDDAVAEGVNNAAQEQSRVARNAAAAVPPADTSGLLVSSPMLDPGKEVTFTFQPPGPGSYTFICTFPGHYLAGMKGTLVID